MSEPKTNLVQSALQDGVLVLTITESKLQDENVAQALLQEILAVIEHSQSRQIAIDCRNLKYMSSVAFAPLLHVRKYLQEVGGRMVLCNLAGVVKDMFENTRMVNSAGNSSAPFDLAGDVPAAVAHLTKAVAP